jgi:ribonuclease HI
MVPASRDYSKITMVTDSEYSIKCITEWSENWKRKGWVTAKGTPVKNQEIIQEILSILVKIRTGKIDINFRHINSHRPAPMDTQNLEWFLWHGNQTVDEKINEIL